MFKGKAALRATRCAQTIPARCLTTSLCPSRFSADSSKVTSPGCPLPQKVYSSRLLRFLRIPRRKCHCPKQSCKVQFGAACRLSIAKVFWPRRTSGSYIFTGFRLENPRKQPYFEKNSAGMEDGDGRLRKGIRET